MKNFLISLAISLGLTAMLSAQNTAFYQEPEATFRSAVELYSKAKYGSAKKQFTWVQSRLDDQEEYMRSEVAYYKAMCDIQLFHKDGAAELIRFINDYPTNSRLNDAYFELANFEYSYKRYKEASALYAKVDPEELSVGSQGLQDYYFRSAYAAFANKNYEDAKLQFSRLIEEETKYRVIAIYYYAYILYTEGNYQSALNEFEKIEEDPTFSSIVPFYILQIYYMQKEYDKVLENGPDLQQEAAPKRAAEIARLIGEAYYHTKQYDQALPYMQSYYNNSSESPDADGRYILGYIYYQQKKYDTAASYFQGIPSLKPQSELAQSALYHLGYCYEKLDKKKFAMDAFKNASLMNFNPVIQEDAMFAYVQLAYSIGLDPYQESLQAAKDFLGAYPKSVYAKKVYTYMLQMYARTKNFEMALNSLSKIEHKNADIQNIEQRLLYNRGVELFYQKKQDSALVCFQRCIDNAFSEIMNARASFWLGECYFAKREYSQALESYKKFEVNSSAKLCSEYDLVFYNMGYTYMELVNYPLAVENFKKYIAFHLEQRTKEKEGESQWNAENFYLQNAYIRLGDCLFMLQNFKGAIEAYDQVLKGKIEPLDYVYYQKALAQGANGNYKEKIQNLLDLINRYPQTKYMASVYAELGSTYLAIENNERAIFYYKRLINDYSTTVLSRSAMLKLGMIYFNLGKEKEALKYLETIVLNYASTVEARQALVVIRNIYMSLNKVDDFFAFVQTLPNVKIEQSEQDSIMYMTAENKYMEGDCAQALSGFKKYVDKFPEGLFVLDAWNYMADCASKNKDWETAKLAYTKIVALPNSVYTDKALKEVARLYYESATYKAALHYYMQLKQKAQEPSLNMIGTIGEMRCLYRLDMAKLGIESALNLLKMDHVPEDIQEEARFYVARLATTVGDSELKMQQYKHLATSKNSNYQAEALYNLMEAKVKDGYLAEAEKMIFDYISNAPSQEYYLAKIYILWADIYEQRGNLLQAKQTLNSIIDNYEGEDLKALAKQKRDAIVAKEQLQQLKDQEQRKAKYEETEEIIIPEM
ncbi:MAG: tetratricopeptide repeat protein [Bacteroidales bacterium]